VPSVAEKIATLQIDRESVGRVREFVEVVRFHMLGGNPVRAADLAIQARAPERVVKAAQDPMTLSSLGTTLAPFQILANAFLASLASQTAFDAMLPSMLQLPLRTRVVSTTATITGVTLPEQQIKRIGSLSLAASDLDVSKAGAVIAVSEEILRVGAEGTARYLENTLRTAVAAATDAAFLTLITAGATSIPSSGANANGARLDLRALLQQITIGAGSRLFLITTPDIAAAWSVLGDSTGAQVFANATYNGGTIGGVRIVASDSCPAQTIIVADAAAIAAGQDELRVDSSRTTSLQMDSAPDSPPTASTNMISLWQLNMVAVLVERFFGAKVVGSNAVAMITGANYTGGSPS
jgi:HK97 family phage major capsid protein